MRIIAGAWRGRLLTAPFGQATRPTAERVRQAVFDMLMHAAWGGRAAVFDGRVLDAFAGTGALGLEALSRGAAEAVFFERDRAALSVLRANIGACRAETKCVALQADALRPPPGSARSLVFLDPPYGQGMVPRTVEALRGAGWVQDGTLLVVEMGAEEEEPQLGERLAVRTHGAARVTIWRAGPPEAPIPEGESAEEDEAGDGNPRKRTI